MMRNTLRLIGILFLLAMPALGQEPGEKGYSALCIEHIGESDTLVLPIFLGTSEAAIQWCRNNSYYGVKLAGTLDHVVSSRLMSELSTEIQTVHGDTVRGAPFGTFAIITLNQKGRHIVILDRTAMLGYVARLKSHWRPSDPIYSELTHLQERIGGTDGNKTEKVPIG